MWRFPPTCAVEDSTSVKTHFRTGSVYVSSGIGTLQASGGFSHDQTLVSNVSNCCRSEMAWKNSHFKSEKTVCEVSTSKSHFQDSKMKQHRSPKHQAGLFIAGETRCSLVSVWSEGCFVQDLLPGMNIYDCLQLSHWDSSFHNIWCEIS